VLMQPAAEKLRPLLESASFKRPAAPVYANATAAPYPEDASACAALLTQQITSPVRWVETVEAMVRNREVQLALEVGPGRVLRGLISKIDRTLPTANVGTVEDFKKLLPRLVGEEEVPANLR